jgi:hypothetical protein
MKDFKKLGKTLSKQEQKNLKGGQDDIRCIETSGCNSDLQCGDGSGADCICGHYINETYNHCIKLT